MQLQLDGRSSVLHYSYVSSVYDTQYVMGIISCWSVFNALLGTRIPLKSTSLPLQQLVICSRNPSHRENAYNLLRAAVAGKESWIKVKAIEQKSVSPPQPINKSTFLNGFLNRVNVV